MKRDAVDKQAQTLSGVMLRTLADPNRLRVLAVLIEADHTAEKISEHLDLGLADVMRSLLRLQRAHLVAALDASPSVYLADLRCKAFSLSIACTDFWGRDPATVKELSRGHPRHRHRAFGARAQADLVQCDIRVGRDQAQQITLICG